MHLMYFTEQPMSAYSEKAGRDFGATALMFSNKHFDPVAGSRLYNEYIEQYMLAEELAMIDMVSRGRLVSGFVRGGGQEQLATGVNPAYNRERFEEAHDLVVKAWTQPGPFRWEGSHYQHRVVNPWAVPLQKPHPRVWIPGVLSKETIIWLLI